MRLLNMEETAKILSISKRTLYQWHWQGKNLPFVKVGGSLKISESDLKDFINQNKRSPIK